MAITSNNLFYKEFRTMMNQRKANGKTIALSKFDVPPMKGVMNGKPKGVIAIVKCIKEPFFDRLNNLEVQLMPKGALYKRKVLSDGSFRIDESGKEVKELVNVKRGSVAVLSDISIGLKRRIEKDGKIESHEVSEGYGYVDYIETQKGRKYIYILPKDCVYRLNMCALVLSLTALRSFYKGAKIALKDGTYVNVYIVPYKYRDNNGVRVLGVKSDNDFDKELGGLLQLWQHNGLVFDTRLTYLEENIRGLTNLGIITLRGSTVDNYTRYDLPLSGEKEELIE